MPEVLWWRDPALVSGRAERWRIGWIGAGVAIALLSVLAVATSGPAGLLGVLIIVALAGLLIGIIYYANTKDMRATVGIENGELVVTSAIPARIPIGVIRGFRVLEEKRTTSSYNATARITSSWSRWVTLLEIDRIDDEAAKHTVVNGYLRTTEAERAALDAALAARLPRLP